jgi:translocator protein
MKDFSKFVIAIAVSQLAGIIGSFFSATSVSSWYTTLIKPELNPPSWVFGPVWITLYFLMGIALFLIWKKGLKTSDVKVAIKIFTLQLILNTSWSIVFFGLQNPALALINVITLLILIIWTIKVFYKISKISSYLLIPYLLWVLFATYLNYAIWILN